MHQIRLKSIKAFLRYGNSSKIGRCRTHCQNFARIPVHPLYTIFTVNYCYHVTMLLCNITFILEDAVVNIQFEKVLERPRASLIDIM